jgi:hypothetical protein
MNPCTCDSCLRIPDDQYMERYARFIHTASSKMLTVGSKIRMYGLTIEEAFDRVIQHSFSDMDIPENMFSLDDNNGLVCSVSPDDMPENLKSVQGCLEVLLFLLRHMFRHGIAMPGTQTIIDSIHAIA